MPSSPGIRRRRKPRTCLSFVRESLQQLEARMRKGRAERGAKRAVKRAPRPRRRAS
jgi:hypothetical protein